jgi:hypothetical protein
VIAPAIDQSYLYFNVFRRFSALRGVWRPDEAQCNLLYLRQLRSNQRLLVKGRVPTDLGEILPSESGGMGESETWLVLLAVLVISHLGFAPMPSGALNCLRHL